jgi:cell division protein FtsW (lipid II flippase)
VDAEIVEHLVATIEPNAKRWIFVIMDSMRHEEFIKVLVTLWAIWTARRKAIH